jgi:ABC-type cobalamin/Fe3+-siderophores transport system ATPase subunit
VPADEENVMLAARDIGLNAGRRVLCRSVYLDIEAGRLRAVLGCNGSVKTTLLHALAGLVPSARALRSCGRRMRG